MYNDMHTYCVTQELESAHGAHWHSLALSRHGWAEMESFFVAKDPITS